MSDINANFIKLLNNCTYTVAITKPLTDWSGGYEEFYQSLEDPNATRYITSVNYVEVVDSIDMMFRTGVVKVYEKNAFTEIFPLSGNEIITIRYYNSLLPESNESGTASKVYHFAITNIKHVPMLTNGPSKGVNNVEISLVEAPAFHLFTNNSVYKTYAYDAGNENTYPKKSMVISDILEDTVGEINQDIPKWYNIDIEETKNTEEDKINFFIPNWSIQKTLQYLLQYCINQKGNPYYTCRIEPPIKEGEKPTIVIKSIYSYMENTSKVHSTTHSYPNRPSFGTDAVVEDGSETTEKGEDLNVLNYVKEYSIDQFDKVATFNGNLSGATGVSFDYISDNEYVGYTYDKFMDSYKGLGKYAPHSMVYGDQWANFGSYSYNEPHRFINYHKTLMAKKNISSGMTCTFTSHVNNMRNVGDLVTFLVKQNIPERQIDYMKSGMWLITKQTDIIIEGESISIVKIVKDGYDIIENVPNGIKTQKHINTLYNDTSNVVDDIYNTLPNVVDRTS